MSVIASMNINMGANTEGAQAGIMKVTQSFYQLKRESSKILDELSSDFEKHQQKMARIGAMGERGIFNPAQTQAALQKEKERYEQTTEAAQRYRQELEQIQRQQQRDLQQAAKIYDRQKSPFANYEAELTQLKSLLDQSMITQEMHAREVAEATRRYQEASPAVQKLRQQMAEARTEQQRWTAEGAKVMQSVMTPLQNYAAELGRLKELQQRGEITAAAFNQKKQEALAIYRQSSPVLQQMNQELQAQVAIQKSMAAEADRLRKSLVSPIKEYQQEIANLRRLQQAGHLNESEVSQLSDQTLKRFREASPAVQKLRQQMAEARAEQQRWAAEGAKVMQSVMTPLQNYAAELARLKELQQRGEITAAAFNLKKQEALAIYRQSSPVLQQMNRDLQAQAAIQKSMAAEADRLRKSLVSPIKEYQQEIANLRRLQQGGHLNAAEFGQLSDQTLQRYRDASPVVQKLRQQMAEARAEQQRWMAEGQKIRQSQITPLQDYQARLDYLSQSLRRGAISQRELQIEVDRAAKKFDQANRAMQRSHSLLGKLTSHPAAKVAAPYFGVAAGVFAVTRGFRSMVTQGMDFEYQMTRTGAIAGATAQEFKQLTEEARRLGATTEHSPLDAAVAMENFAMAGLEVNEILESTSAALALATVGKMSIGEAADISMRMLNAFQLEARQLTDVIDIMAYASTNSASNMQELGEALKFAAPGAAIAGYDFTQTTAGLMTMSEVFRGEMAGTALRGIINQMASTSQKGQRTLDRLGIKVKDAAGNFRGLADIVDDFNRSLENMGSADRSRVITDVFAARAGAGMAILMQAGGDAIRENEEGAKRARGEAERLRKAFLQNMAGDVELLRSAWQEFQITVFSTDLGTFFRAAIQGATKLTEAIGWATEKMDWLLKIIPGPQSLAMDFLRMLVSGDHAFDPLDGAGGLIEFSGTKNSLSELRKKLAEQEAEIKKTTKSLETLREQEVDLQKKLQNPTGQVSSSFTASAAGYFSPAAAATSDLEGLKRLKRELEVTRRAIVSHEQRQRAQEENSAVMQMSEKALQQRERMVQLNEDLRKGTSELLLSQRELFLQEIQSLGEIDRYERHALVREYDRHAALKQRLTLEEQLRSLQTAYYQAGMSNIEKELEKLRELGATYQEIQQAEALMRGRDAIEEHAREWEQIQASAEAALNSLKSPLDNYLEKLQEINHWQQQGLIPNQDAYDKLVQQQTQAYQNATGQNAQARIGRFSGTAANSAQGYSQMVESQYRNQEDRQRIEREKQQLANSNRLVKLLQQNNRLASQRQRPVVAKF